MKKTKGFTLIELIAVIAILAILGAVLVPKILGYRTKAKRSNIQTSAKEILHAIQAYNADKDVPASGAAATATAGQPITGGMTISDVVPIVNGDGGSADSIIKTSGDDYKALSTKTVDDLVNIADGKFSYDGTTITAGTSEKYAD